MARQLSISNKTAAYVPALIFFLLGVILTSIFPELVSVEIDLSSFGVGAGPASAEGSATTTLNLGAGFLILAGWMGYKTWQDERKAAHEYVQARSLWPDKSEGKERYKRVALQMAIGLGVFLLILGFSIWL